MALVLTQVSSQLAASIHASTRRRFKNAQGEDTGIQRIGHLTSNAGQTYTLYYDPSADEIIYDTGTPNLNQQ